MTQLVTLAAIDKAGLQTWLNATLTASGFPPIAWTYMATEYVLDPETGEPLLDPETGELVEQEVERSLWTNGESASTVIDGTTCDIFHDADWCNIAFNGPAEVRLKGVLEAAILTPGTTGQITATRGTLTWPKTASGPALAFPASPSHGFAGVPVQPSPEVEVIDPLEVYPEWYQRTAGLQPADEVPQVGTIEHIDGALYIVETAQTDLGGVLVNYFRPDALNGGWRRISATGGLDPWAPGPYALDAEVLYEPDSTEWRNRRPNNNQAFAPPVSGSGWMQIGPGAGPFPWKHVGNEGYPTPWQVTHNGRIWSNPSAGNFWEPGVAIWVDEGPA